MPGNRAVPALSPSVAETLRQYAPAAAAILGNLVAPGIGGVVAGGLAKVAADALSPKAEMAVEVLGSKLGVSKPTIERINSVVLDALETRPTDLERALQDADRVISVRLAEMAHAEEMGRIDNANVADARATFGSQVNWFQYFVGVLALLMAGGVFAAILLGYADTKDAQTNLILGTVLGLVGSWAGSVVNYHYGSSSGSAQKSSTLDAIAKAR